MEEQAAEAATILRAWLAEATTGLASKKQQAAAAAINQLEAVAGGGGQEGQSWKAALKPTSSWEDVLHEAAYHLCAGAHGQQWSISGTLDPLFIAVQKAWDDYATVAKECGRAVDAELLQKRDQANAVARATATEAYFIDVLTACRPDQVAGKVQQRIAQMSKHHVDPELLQPLVWQKAKAVSMK